MLLSSIAVLLLSLSSSSFAHKYDSACKRELQGILYSPNSCAEKYFSGLDKQLRKLTPLLFSSQEQSIIENFENTYGVSITVVSPFQVICNDYSNTDSVRVREAQGIVLPFGNEVGPNVAVLSMKVSVNTARSDNNAGNMRLGLVFDPNSVSPASLSLYSGTCSGTPGVIASFQDGGLAVTDNCANLNDGLTFAPQGGSIISTIETNGYKANTPIYLSILSTGGGGQSYTQFNSATLTICSAGAFGYDVAKSNLKVPGLRLDNGLYYYTSVYQDEYGNMKYITISSALNSIIC